MDRVQTTVGFRSFRMDPKEGFFLNGRAYPLHGVSRHQDRKGLGNALTKEHHDEDMALIRELGAFAVDETGPEGLVSRYFHRREDAIAHLSRCGSDAALRATTLEDVFVDCAGRKII